MILSDRLSAMVAELVHADLLILLTDIDALYDAFISEIGDRPRAIIARTVKGKGISFCEGLYTWHHNVLTDSLYQQAIQELNCNSNG